MSEKMPQITCAGCCLVCDDVTITIKQQSQPDCNTSCVKAKKWIESALNVDSPPSEQNCGQTIETATKWLRQSRAPLICGFDALTLEATSCLVELAQKENAFLSAATSPDKISSYQRYGGASCTLGEIRHRADLVLVANCDLQSICPRFEEQVFAKPARFLSKENQRQIIYLGDPNRLANSSIYTKTISATSQFEQTITSLRIALQNDQSEKQSDDEINKLAQSILNAEYPVLIHDDSQPTQNVLWTKLVAEANLKSRMHSLQISEGFAKGAPSETILAMTGFPDHIAFHNDSIRHDAHRYQAARLIEKQETDLVIFAGVQISKKWIANFQKLNSPTKLIVIHAGQTKLPELEIPVLEIQTKTPGIHETGTTLRCDGVAIPLQQFAKSQWQSITQIAKSLLH